MSTAVSDTLLDETPLKTVPILGTIKLPDTIQELVSRSMGKSTVLESQNREGIVLRALRDNSVSFKVINPEYLLKEE